ncbi:MAG: hypothetical protein J6K61_06940 [Clostridia bacterium]|nr:hypothetical protein [Clostridia bacterium]
MAKQSGFAKWFYNQSFLIQLILLLIPVVNWIVEIGVRWSAFFQRKNPITLIFALVVLIFGQVFGWIDLVWLLLTTHLLFAKA